MNKKWAMVILLFLVGILIYFARAPAMNVVYKDIAIEAFNNKEYKKAERMFELLCNIGHAKSCYVLGVGYFKGEGFEKNLRKAFNYFQKGCESGNPDSCYNIGVKKVEIGDLLTANIFFKKAFFLYEEQCINDNNIDSCRSYKRMVEDGYSEFY